MKDTEYPSMVVLASIVSLVVPGSSLTMALSSPISRLSSVDLPTFGSPVMATIIPSLISVSYTHLTLPTILLV